MIERLVEASEGKGLKLNATKTKVMVISKANENIRVNIRLNGEELEQVERFKYLGSYITRDGRCEEEIRMRINMAKDAFQKIKSLVTNRAISLSLRKRFLKTYVWSTLLYGCEAWTSSKKLEEKLEAVEMRLLRRMMRISWVKRVS